MTSPRLLPGGYLGVDVFFVISGFVITGSLAQRPASGLGDLMLSFYGRRIRRLLPALLVCVLISALVLCLVNPDPGQMLGVGWRALFGTSNLILHRLAVDYFRPAAELNPFTQTWSLGVEEQFYLLFPLLVWFSGFARTGRDGSRRLLWLLILLVVASFGVFVHQLGVDVPAAFFLLPGRFWELGVGGLLWLSLSLRNPTAPDPAAPPAPPEAVPGGRVGIAAPIPLPLPLAALLALIAVTALPLPFGMVPVAAAVALTALLLGTVRAGTAAHGLLSSPPLVFLGLISYSLYLCHWSVLTLARWTVGVSATTIPLLVGLMLALAVISWRWVEEPLRRSPWWPERWQVVATGLLLAALGTGLLQALTRQGSALLFQGDRNAALAAPSAPAAAEAPDCSGPGQGRLLFAGDSHAHVFMSAAEHLCRHHGLGYGEAATVGMPYPPLHYTNPATGMSREDAITFALVEERRWASLQASLAGDAAKRNILVLALRWPLYFDPGFLPDSALRRTSHFDPFSDLPLSRSEALGRWIAGVDEIAAANPRTPIVLLLPTPEFGGGVPMELCQPQWFRPQPPLECRTGLDRRDLDRLSAYLKRQLQPLVARHPHLMLHDPLDALCPAGTGHCPRLRDGRLLYSDGDHLTGYGASLVLDDLMASLRRRTPPASDAGSGSAKSAAAAKSGP
ncbi:MAG: acyltransferase family protein [Cyanobacteria bacterium]|nr:acyltransferase family protein [Cyanobacteriota bacterium]